MAKITLGPIIGKVTDTTARILIEIDSDATVVCNATDNAGNTLEFSDNLKKNRPFAFALNGLQPNTEYKIIFTGVDGSTPNSRVKTFESNTERMNVAAVSCNFPSRNGENDMWGDLRDRFVVPNDVDLLLHVGDQVYGDSVFDKAMSIIRLNNPKGKKAQDEAISELYRGLYRKNWTEPTIRSVLANVSNLMIWDDHEIRDDWGSRADDSNPEKPAYRIGSLARDVYREYQRQLWDDAFSSSAPTSSDEQHFHSWGKIGILFVDQRGGRSFGKDNVRPYLGTRQWNDIVKQLTGGELSKVRALIVVTSVPLVYLSSSMTDLGDFLVNDLLDHWSHPKYTKEQIEMIRALRDWKDADDGQRELLVVGGDVHVGANTDIKHNNKTIFRQLITSPITNHPPKTFLFIGLKSLIKDEARLSESYSFKHTNLTNLRNYGIIIVRVPPSGVPKVEGSLQKES